MSKPSPKQIGGVLVAIAAALYALASLFGVEAPEAECEPCPEVICIGDPVEGEPVPEVE